MISYLRLYNGGASAATFTVKVVGSPTGRDYGDAIFSVPAGATRQLSLSQVLQGAQAYITAPDTNFSFYIRSTEPLAGYQHVSHSPSVSYFENSSVCRTSLQEIVRQASNQMVLPSIHTSRLAAAGYPASIEVHNFAASANVFRFTVLDEITGFSVGSTLVTMQANASYTIPWSEIESLIHWTPTAEQIRANLVVTDPNRPSAPTILLSQSIINNALQVTLNMTTMCAVNADTDGTGGTGGSGGGLQLTVAKAGTGVGTVTSTVQPGISCGTICTYGATANVPVTLTAAAAAGSAFTGWSGACTGTSLTCTVTLTSAQTVTASFASSTLTVTKIGSGTGTVTSEPAGIDCGSVCTGGFSPQAPMLLTAVPAAGSTFLSWSGCANSSGPTGNLCTVDMSTNKIVTATFGGGGTLYKLTLSKAGTGHGVVTSTPTGLACDSDCTGTNADFSAGTTVTLLASPSGGTTFQGWSGACTGTGSCSVLMSAAQNVTASFGPNLNALTVTVVGRGQVVSSPAGINCGLLGSDCTAAFVTGATASLSAGAGGTFQNFLGWSGPCASISTNPGDSICNVVAGGTQSITANFRP
jgi:hypothetical protein